MSIVIFVIFVMFMMLEADMWHVDYLRSKGKFVTALKMHKFDEQVLIPVLLAYLVGIILQVILKYLFRLSIFL